MTAGTRALYLLMRAVGKLACLLPRKVTLAIAAAFAQGVWLLYRLTPYRGFVPSNIRGAWPNLTVREAAALGRRSLLGLTRSIAEVMRFPLFGREADSIVQIQGSEPLERALSQGRGAIIVTAHFGNWELMGAALARRFGPVCALVQTPSKDAFSRLFIEYRRKVGVRTYSNSGPQSLRPALRALREGQILALLCDQHGPAKEARGTLLGRPVWVPQGPFILARRTGSAIIPAHIVRSGDQGHCLILEPELPLVEDPDANAQALLDRYTAWIEQNPDHWLWVHNRWEFLADESSTRGQGVPGRVLGAVVTLLLTLALGVCPAQARSSGHRSVRHHAHYRTHSHRVHRHVFVHGRSNALPITADPAGALADPVIVAYHNQLEVVDMLHVGTHGFVAIPGPADAAMLLAGKSLLAVHIPSQDEVALVDLRPLSPTRFQIVRAFRASEFGAFDLGFARAGNDLLLGFGRTVVAHFDLTHWDFEVGFDRPDEIPYPFSTGSTLYLPFGIFELHGGEVAVEDASATSWSADERPIELALRPTALLAEPGGPYLYVSEAGVGRRGALACIDARSLHVVCQVYTPFGLRSLAWTAGRNLVVLADDRLGAFDIRRHAFVRWIPLRYPGGRPLRLFSAG